MSILKELDFISFGPILYYNNKKVKKSYIGALFSTAIIILCSTFFIYFLIRMFDRSNIKVITAESFIDDGVWNYSEFQQPILITDLDGKVFTKELEDRMFQLKIIFFWTKPGSSAQENIFFDLERCDLNKHFGKYKKYFEQRKDIERYFCLPPMNLTLFGYYGSSNPFSATYTHMTYCDESKRSDCLPKNETIKILSDFYFEISFLDFIIDHASVDQPNIMYLRNERVPVSSGMNKRFFFYMNLVDYITDIGYVFEDKQTRHLFVTKDYSLHPSEKSDTFLFAITFTLSKIKSTHVKTFMKFQQVLSNIGGSFKAILMIGTILNKFLTKKFYFLELSNQSLTFLENHPIEDRRQVVHIFRPPKIHLNSNAPDNLNVNNVSKLQSSIGIGINIKEKKRQSLQLSQCDNLRLWMVCCKVSKANQKYFQIAEQKMIQNLSVQNIVKKQNQLDQLKVLLLGDNFIPLLDQIYTPNTHIITSKLSKDISPPTNELSESPQILRNELKNHPNKNHVLESLLELTSHLDS